MKALKEKKQDSARGVDAKTKKGQQGVPVKPKEVPKGDKFVTKPSPRRATAAVPKTDSLPDIGGATTSNFLGSDLLNDPIEESPSKVRAASQQQKARPGKPASGQPYLQQ